MFLGGKATVSQWNAGQAEKNVGCPIRTIPSNTVSRRDLLRRTREKFKLYLAAHSFRRFSLFDSARSHESNRRKGTQPKALLYEKRSTRSLSSSGKFSSSRSSSGLFLSEQKKKPWTTIRTFPPRGLRKRREQCKSIASKAPRKNRVRFPCSSP